MIITLAVPSIRTHPVRIMTLTIMHARIEKVYTNTDVCAFYICLKGLNSLSQQIHGWNRKTTISHKNNNGIFPNTSNKSLLCIIPYTITDQWFEISDLRHNCLSLSLSKMIDVSELSPGISNVSCGNQIMVILRMTLICKYGLWDVITKVVLIELDRDWIFTEYRILQSIRVWQFSFQIKWI